MKNIFSIFTFAVALAAGLVFANIGMAGSLDRVNGISHLSKGSDSFDTFQLGPAPVIEDGSAYLGGANEGGLTAGGPGRKNGITYFSTGPAIFDSGLVGPDTGGSRLNSLPRKSSGNWPEDYS